MASLLFVELSLDFLFELSKDLPAARCLQEPGIIIQEIYTFLSLLELTNMNFP